jgi:uncharacterized membrane protein YvbJ
MILMVCKACGRNSSSEDANYCEYCGTSFRENVPSFRQEDYQFSNTQQSAEANTGSEKPISFGNWMGTLLLPFIPVVGIFIYIVMMFVWAFGNDTPASKKNWARASLIVTAVSIVLLIFMFTSVMMDIINSGVDINQYMKEFY